MFVGADGTINTGVIVGFFGALGIASNDFFLPSRVVNSTRLGGMLLMKTRDFLYIAIQIFAQTHHI